MIPPYRPAARDWLDALIALMEREAFDLVIPCDDERLLPLAAHRAELERHVRLALPSDEALAILTDKLRTTELARSLGLPVPREAVVAAASDAAALRASFSPPLILKPPRSFTLADLEEKREVARADSWEEVDLLLDELLVEGPVAVQELVAGEGVGVELLLRDGAPLLAFQHVRLHEPMHGGGSSYRRSVPVSPELLEAATTLLGALHYTGVAMVEFKREPGGGRWVLLEVNARFWGSLPLALAAGADFPLALFELLVEGRTEFPSAYRTGLCARNLGADAQWHVENRRADRHDPTLSSRPWTAVARETGAALLRARERSDTLTRDDPAPALAEAGQMARDVVHAVRLRAPVALAQRSARRRNALRARAQAALAGGQRVLFVCHGNIARSPFAAAVAERAARDGQEVRSAGMVKPGRRSPADALAAAAAWDVDLDTHRSVVVSEELVRSSDAIFVFDYRNYSQLVRRFPEARDRIHPFGALERDGSLFVPDPWGRGAAVYEATYRRIATALTRG